MFLQENQDLTSHMKEIINFFVNLVLMETWRGKLLAGSLAVFLLAFLIIPNAGFAGSMLDNPTQNETGPIRFDKYAGVFIGPGFMKNRIIDVDGFADWGSPGSVSKYDDTGFVGGVLVGENSMLVA